MPEHEAHGLHLMVGDDDEGTAGHAVGAGCAVGHEAVDIWECHQLSALLFGAVYEYFGGDDETVYCYAAAVGADALFLLGGYVGFVALGGEVAEYVQFVVVVDDCHIPFGFGHAYGVVGDRRCHRRKRVGCRCIVRHFSKLRWTVITISKKEIWI